MWQGIIILILSFLVAVMMDVIADEKKINMAKWIYICGVIGGMALVFMTYRSLPKAIDVYQGKTTLEITYKDGIPVDSIVVYKK